MEKLFFFLLPLLAYLGMSFMAWDFTWLFESPAETPASFVGRLVLVGATILAIAGYVESER